MKDFHIHTSVVPGQDVDLKNFRETSLKYGFDGGNIFSFAPAHFCIKEESKFAWQPRLEQLLYITSQLPYNPVFWADPTEKDFTEQLDACVKAGVRAIKIICSHYYPGDVLPQLQQIADRDMGIIFHSGVIYAHNCKAEYSRPLNFEALMNLKNARISLAHLSWPWCEECLSMYGAFAWKRTTASDAPELFLDLTPGTPLNRRREFLKMAYCTGYDIAHNILWGSDNAVGANQERAYSGIMKYYDLDKKIFEEIVNETEYPTFNPDNEDLFKLATEENIKRFMKI